MILLVDNYDSFVFNLARYVEELGFSQVVKRNDQITLSAIQQLRPSHILLSPGPKSPSQAGICLELIKTFAASTPILGVCLGHQAIGQAFGAEISLAQAPMHGKSSQITHHEKGLFYNVPSPLKVARYHSLIVKKSPWPADLLIDAVSPEGEIMAIHHKIYPTFGVQFHPESVLTEYGYQIIENFLRREECQQRF